MGKLLALLLCTTALSAVDWEAYDKRLHFAGGALGAYVVSDILERKTDLSPGARWLISAGSLVAAGWIYEATLGAYDAKDGQATQLGAVFGATAQGGVSFLFTRDAVGVGYSARF